MMVAYTSISRGKYILVIRLLFPTSALVELVKLNTNRFQGRRATDKKMIKGTPSESTFNTTEKTKFMVIS